MRVLLGRLFHRLGQRLLRVLAGDAVDVEAVLLLKLLDAIPSGAVELHRLIAGRLRELAARVQEPQRGVDHRHHHGVRGGGRHRLARAGVGVPEVRDFAAHPFLLVVGDGRLRSLVVDALGVAGVLVDPAREMELLQVELHVFLMRLGIAGWGFLRLLLFFRRLLLLLGAASGIARHLDGLALRFGHRHRLRRWSAGDSLAARAQIRLGRRHAEEPRHVHRTYPRLVIDDLAVLLEVPDLVVLDDGHPLPLGYAEGGDVDVGNLHARQRVPGVRIGNVVGIGLRIVDDVDEHRVLLRVRAARLLQVVLVEVEPVDGDPRPLRA